MPNKPRRRSPPIGVKIRACLFRLDVAEERHDELLRISRGERRALLQSLLDLLGFRPDQRIEWNHSPPLGLREILPDGSDWFPGQHDPQYLYPEDYDEHRRTTSGHAPGEGYATVANSDQHKIAKAERIRRAQGAFLRDNASELNAATEEMLTYGSSTLEVTADGRARRVEPRRWPPKGSRKIRSRGFDRRK